MINFTFSDRDEAVSFANAILRDGGTDCAVYTPTDDPELFMVLDAKAASAYKPDELLLDYNPERRRWPRVPYRVEVRVTPLETAHA